MNTLVKKTARNMAIAVVSVFGILTALFLRLFLGNSYFNLSDLESKTDNNITKGNLISAANADTSPVPDACGDACGGTDVCAPECCDSGDAGGSSDGGSTV